MKNSLFQPKKARIGGILVNSQVFLGGGVIKSPLAPELVQYLTQINVVGAVTIGSITPEGRGGNTGVLNWPDVTGAYATFVMRAHYVASVYGAPMMVRAKRGLIVNISSPAGGMYIFSASYGVGKAGLDRLAKDMAHELKPHGVAAVSLWPGAVKTEFVIEAAKSGKMDLTNAESPIFTGRAVTALASDPNRMQKSGRVLIVAELAKEYGFEDEA